MDRIYADLPADKIPWNRESPPAILRALVESGTIAPCRAIEFGCGAGNHVIWLASRGFDATGVDLSAVAIGMATRAASGQGVACRFVAADVLGDLAALRGPFDFAYDWELLHHIVPPDRPKYVANVARLLPAGGRYLSVCFSEKSPGFGGTGKYRRTPLDTVLYFSSEAEMVSLFEPLFVVDVISTVDIEGKGATHEAVRVLMTRR